MSWLYDIILNESLVGDSGDLEFDTKEEALADAHNYIISELSGLYNASPKEFEISFYERFI